MDERRGLWGIPTELTSNLLSKKKKKLTSFEVM
jgi:hypothetical protein